MPFHGVSHGHHCGVFEAPLNTLRLGLGLIVRVGVYLFTYSFIYLIFKTN